METWIHSDKETQRDDQADWAGRSSGNLTAPSTRTGAVIAAPYTCVAANCVIWVMALSTTRRTRPRLLKRGKCPFGDTRNACGHDGKG